MKLIDTHSHIYSSQFENDIYDVIARAKDNNIEKILLPNVDLESIPQMMNLVSEFPDICIPMMGIHPTSIKENYREDLAIAKKYLDENKFIAIGEIGIDLYWDKTFVEQQKEAFRIQIQWSIDYGLPVVIHARDAFDEIFEVLDEFDVDNFNGVFHSFTGNIEQAQKAMDLGFYIGINGIVTFKNSGLDKVVELIPVDRILLETDSPYLAPVPNRGKRNESAFLLSVAQKIADIYKISIYDLAEITTKNAQYLFKIT